MLSTPNIEGSFKASEACGSAPKMGENR